MKHRNWLQEICSVPNLLSLLRLGLIPVYVYIYFRGEFILAGAVLALSCLTDYWDGWIARRFHMITDLGKFLDPLADKATQFALLLCLSTRYPALRSLWILFLVKESLQAAAALFFLHRGWMLPGAIWAGKICTTAWFISLFLLVVLPTLPGKLVTSIGVMNGFLLMYALVGYGFAYFGRNRKLEKLE